MTFRKLSQAVACLAGLAAVSSGALRAQQPGQDAAKALASDSQLASEALLLSAAEEDLANSAAINSLSLVAATYGNPLGVEVGDVDAALRTQLGIEDGVGVVVTSVSKDSEAAKAGLEAHDLVTGSTTRRSPG